MKRRLWQLPQSALADCLHGYFPALLNSHNGDLPAPCCRGLDACAGVSRHAGVGELSQHRRPWNPFGRLSLISVDGHIGAGLAQPPRPESQDRLSMGLNRQLISAVIGANCRVSRAFMTTGSKVPRLVARRGRMSKTARNWHLRARGLSDGVPDCMPVDRFVDSQRDSSHIRITEIRNRCEPVERARFPPRQIGV